jgi:hypothetical protein
MTLEAGVGAPPAADATNARIGIVGIVAAAALRTGRSCDVEKDGELRIGHLVTVEPEVPHVHAVARRFVGRTVVAAHPEGARLHEHDSVRRCRRRRQQRGEEHEKRARHTDVDFRARVEVLQPARANTRRAAPVTSSDRRT